MYVVITKEHINNNYVWL